jgi:hypothetical protein
VTQQINLYQPIFRRQKKVFSAVTMLQVSALFLVVLFSLFLYGQMKLQPLKQQLDRINTDTASLNLQLAKLEAQLPGASKSKLLENEIAKLSGELAKRKQIQELLTSRTAGNNEGLSAYLEAFARQHVQGIWLTRFTIANGGKSLGLQGKTLSSELVPVYIEKLAAEALLKGTSFNVMELVRTMEPSSQLDFRVSTN